MNQKQCVPFLLALALFSLALPAFAGADTYQFRGQNIFADWEGFDGCIDSFTFVEAFGDRSHAGPGAPVSLAEVEVGIFVYDYCQLTDLVSLFGVATLPAGTRLISGGLQSATIQATVQAIDYLNGGSVPVTIGLHWDGQGEVFRSSSSSSFQSRNFRYRTRSTGNLRNATMTGDVVAGGVSYAPPGSLVEARLFDSQSGSVFIIH
jgi:hypothetical protein